MSKVIFTEEGTKPPAPSAGQISMYVKTDEVLYIQDSAGIETALGTSSGITSLVGEATGTGPGAATVTLSNAAVIAKVLTGFVAGPNSSVGASDSILVALQKLQAQVTAGGGGITALTGDVSASGPGSAAATVNAVGGLSAALVAAGSALANAATSANTSNDIVRRDNTGSFIATNIVSNLTGNVTGNVTGTASGNTTTATAPLSSTGGTTPNISISQAGTSSNGYLSAADWNTFNSKSSNPSALVTQTVYVAVGGNDTTGDGTIGNPFQTVSKALSSITTAGSDNRFMIKLMGGKIVDTTTPLLKPWVYIVGDHEDGTYWKVTASGNNVGLDPSFATVGGARFGLANVYLGAGTNLNMDLYSIGPNTGTPSAEMDLENIYVTGNLIFNGRSPDIDFMQIKGLFVFGTFSADAAQMTVIGSSFQSAVNLSSTRAASSSQWSACVFQAAFNMTGTNANTQQITASPIFGAVSVSGATSVLSADSTSLPPFASQTLSSGGTITLLGDAHNSKYTPTTPANWPTPPTSVAQALDDLASANDLIPFTGDTGTGGTQGLVPAPGAGTKAAGDFLKADGTWSYVDQSKPIYNPFSFIGITPWTGSTAAKFENVATYTGIDGHKQYAALVAGGGAGTLFIWDITDPAIPTLCSFAVLSGAYNVSVAQISGSIYAFVPSSGASTLYTVNITNPYSLVTTSTLPISGSPGSLYNCAYSNGYVYIATQNKGLTVVDVGGGLAGGTITAPIQSYQEGGTTNKTAGVAVFGNFVYTTNYQTTFPATVRYLKTWELAAGGGTLAIPFLANTYTISGGPTGTSTKPLGIALNSTGTTAYVTDGNQGIIDIIDTTSPTAPNYLNYVTPSYTLTDNSLGVAIVTTTPAGNYLYVPSGSSATNGGCIDLFDVTVPAAPIKVKSAYTGVANDVFGGISLNSGYIFGADYGVSGGYSGIAVFSQAFLSPTLGLPVTSNIQVQQLTPNTALVSNGSQQLASSTTTATELGYVHGVTSSIQTQINNLNAASILNALIFG